MSDFPKCCVSFRIYDDFLDPKQITEILNIEPDVSIKKGDQRIFYSKKGKILEHSPYNTELWVIDSKKDKKALLQEHIESLLLELDKMYPIEWTNEIFKTLDFGQYGF